MDEPSSRSRFRPETNLKPREISVTMNLNGEQRTLAVAPWTTLLDALRDRLGLTGAKKGCDHGQCGACTVLVEGRRVNSCLTLAIMKDGAHITTIEGLAADGVLHPLQQAFIDVQAVQCGACYNGMTLKGAELLSRNAKPAEAEIRDFMNGHLCRCGTYDRIRRAIHRAAGTGATR